MLLEWYSLFDVRQMWFFIVNKNKTSYDALSVDALFISSASTSNIFHPPKWAVYAVLDTSQNYTIHQFAQHMHQCTPKIYVILQNT